MAGRGGRPDQRLEKPVNGAEMPKVIAQQPVAIPITTSRPFYSYKSGNFNEEGCLPEHACGTMPWSMLGTERARTGSSTGLQGTSGDPNEVKVAT